MKKNSRIQIAQSWNDVKKDESERLVFLSSILSKEKQFDGFQTEILVPKNRSGNFRLSISGSQAQTSLIHQVRHFDIIGSYFTTTSKTAKTNVSLKNAWASIIESEVFADVEISRALIQSPELRIERNYDREKGNFEEIVIFISRSKVFKEWGSNLYSYDGTVEKGKFQLVSVELKDGPKIEFSSHYEHIFRKELIITIPNQVGVVTGVQNEDDLRSQINSIEDLILLGSFVENQRVQLLGYSVRAIHQITDCYFLNRSLSDFDESSHDFTIPENLFNEFLNTAHRRLLESPFRDAIRQAINRIVSPPDILEYAFITGFSALETLLDAYKGHKNNGLIFKDGWDAFQNQIKKSIKTFDLSPPLSSIQRREIYSKIPELNRRAFHSVLNEFSTEYKIKLDDLWTVSGSPGKNTLLDIRNRIVHGGIMKPGGFDILWKAEDNLVWVLKRMILALLGWDFNLSSVKPETLSRSIPYKEWPTLIAGDGIFEEPKSKENSPPLKEEA